MTVDTRPTAEDARREWVCRDCGAVYGSGARTSGTVRVHFGRKRSLEHVPCMDRKHGGAMVKKGAAT